jgi:hypothetical protein
MSISSTACCDGDSTLLGWRGGLNSINEMCHHSSEEADETG